MKIRLKRWLAVLLSVCLLLAGNGASAHADGTDTDSGNTPIELEITNNVPMFKAISAFLEENEGQMFLVMALSGTGFHELFKGTYEQAVANGDGTESGNGTWIHGHVNDNGKWEFRIPVEEGDSFIPLVAISDSFYNRYLNGQNALERAFFARCLLLDPDAATLAVEDYEFTDPLTVTNTAGKFSVTDACLKTQGGPNNTQYSCCLNITIENNPFDCAFIFDGSADEMDEDAAAIPAQADGVFELPVKWAESVESQNILTNLLNEPFKVFFHSSAESVWVGFQFTVNEADRTLEIICPAFGEADFAMPFSLTVLELNAFEGVSHIASVDASHCASIGAEAFKNCTELTRIRLPKDCEIDETAFTGCTKLQFICAPAGGTTEEYCAKMQIMFVPE